MGTHTGPAALPASVHQLKIKLEGIEPPIWRRVLVPSDVTLGNLHVVIQVAMGWDDSHLHVFEAGKISYGDAMFEDPDMLDEHVVRLDEVAPRKRSKLRYEYDMGDGWKHTLVVEAVTPADPAVKTPVCLEGERACPPEDCGGVWGYAELLETLSDPNSPEYEEMMEWIGPIDPEAFDLEKVNKTLVQFQHPPKRRRRSG